MVMDIWKRIREPHRTFIIAEAGVNHNGDLDVAREMTVAAARAGADAVKFQTFKAGKLVTAQAPKAAYQKRQTDTRESQLEMLKRLELSEDDHAGLMDCCKQHNILFMSTPFEEDSADLLFNLGISVLKIPSGEITNLPFLEHVALKGLPIILSTGMATLGEVETAVNLIEKTGNRRLALLHCVSNYPADFKDVNLRAMLTMGTAFDVPVGYSDHTIGIDIPLAAVALGARIIEKHFTLDRKFDGPDHRASLEPEELTRMVQGIRRVEQATGNGRKAPSVSELDTASVVRKSLVAARDIPSGQKLTPDLIEIKRPGNGLPPSAIHELIGRKVNSDINKGELFTRGMIQ